MPDLSDGGYKLLDMHLCFTQQMPSKQTSSRPVHYAKLIFDFMVPVYQQPPSRKNATESPTES